MLWPAGFPTPFPSLLSLLSPGDLVVRALVHTSLWLLHRMGRAPGHTPFPSSHGCSPCVSHPRASVPHAERPLQGPRARAVCLEEASVFHPWGQLTGLCDSSDMPCSGNPKP